MKIKIGLSFLIWAIIFFHQACSQMDPKERKIEVLSPQQPEVSKDSTHQSFGPTKKIETHFSDKTEAYGLSGIRGTHFYSVDLNRDLHDDLVLLPDHYSIPEFYLFNPLKAQFEKIESPFQTPFRASYLLFLDFNHDHLLDLLAVSFVPQGSWDLKPLRLFVGRDLPEKKTISFVEQEDAFPKSLQGAVLSSVVALDYNLDGSLDLFLGQWFKRENQLPKVFPDILLEGNGFQFKDVSFRLEGERKLSSKNFINASPTLAASTCDLDQDGHPDILTSNSAGYPNKLWLSQKKEGHIYFKDYGHESGYAQDKVGELQLKGGGNSLFSLCTDYNNDRIMDVLIGELSHSIDPEIRDRSSFLTGKRFEFPPSFLRSEFYQESGKLRWSEADRRASFFDPNLDGFIDALVDNAGFPPESRLLFLFQHPDHEYEDLAPSLGIDIVNPSGTVVIDPNKDGRPDFLTGQTDLGGGGLLSPRVYLFQNVLQTKNKALRLFLRGESANSLGIGSMMRVKAGAMAQTRWLEYNSGAQGSQHQEGLLFGVGESEKLESITITWPILDEKTGKAKKVSYDYSKRLKDYQELTLYESGKICEGRCLKEVP